MAEVSGKPVPGGALDPAFAALADSPLVGHVVADSHGTIVYANAFFADLHGYEREELLGKNISLLHSPEQLAVSQRIIAESVAAGSTAPQEHWYRHRDGSDFPLLVSCVTAPSQDGAETYTALAAIDLEPVQRAEMAYTTLFDEMLDGFAHHEIICDDSGTPVDYRFIAANPAFERMTGLAADDDRRQDRSRGDSGRRAILDRHLRPRGADRGARAVRGLLRSAR